MLGLVLWSDPKLGKALIWCEDQKDLAYFDETQEAQNAETFVPEVGDVVLCDLRDGADLRRATNLRKLAHKAAGDLIAQLKEVAKSARAQGAAGEGAQNTAPNTPKNTVARFPARHGASGEISSPKKERA